MAIISREPFTYVGELRKSHIVHRTLDKSAYQSISVSRCEGLGFNLLSLMLSLIWGLVDSAFILEGVIAREANLIN